MKSRSFKNTPSQNWKGFAMLLSIAVSAMLTKSESTSASAKKALVFATDDRRG